jgi:uncharacterized surface protein with fasciclin (FAS1) repeats
LRFEIEDLTMTKTFFSGAALAVIALAAPLAVSAQDAPVPAIVAPPPAATAAPVSPSGDIITTAQTSGQFGTLLKALDASNLTAVLKNNPGLTVFAPTDAAFAALPAGELDRLLTPANAGELQKILTYHVINARVDSTKIKGAKGEVKTVEGTSVMLDGSTDAMTIDGANIVQADVMATNGLVHVIDRVLIPGAHAAQAAAAAPADPAAAPGAGAPAT